MSRRALVLIASALLSSGCVRRLVIPDPTVPHRVAKEAKVQIWVETADGKWVKQKVKILEGWWVASPQVVE